VLEDYADGLHPLRRVSLCGWEEIIAVGQATAMCAWYVFKYHAPGPFHILHSKDLAVFQIALPISPIIAVVLFEPFHILRPVIVNDERILRGQLNIRGVQSRRTMFPWREEASLWLRQRTPWKYSLEVLG
jgi:hypothetical protein